MTKKLTVQEIYTISSILNKLANLSVPVKLAYAIGKNLKIINNEIEGLNVIRQKLIDDYAERDSEGKIVIMNDVEIKLKEETKNEFREKFKEFIEMEVELNVFTIPLSEFINSDVTLTPTEMSTLGFILEDEHNIK